MIKAISSILAVSALGACAHRPLQVAHVPALPLPTLSLQRQLELRTGFRGDPGSMAFLDLVELCEARGDEACVRGVLDLPLATGELLATPLYDAMPFGLPAEIAGQLVPPTEQCRAEANRVPLRSAFDEWGRFRSDPSLGRVADRTRSSATDG